MSEERTWEHGELQSDLAAYRRQCGDMVLENCSPGRSGGFIDVLTLQPSWTRPNPTVYEVKVRRGDFMGDTQGGKYEQYLPHSRRLYFATPRGLVEKKEVPVGMGLIVRGPKGWYVVKAPRCREVDKAVLGQLSFRMLLRLHPNGPTPMSRLDRARALAEAEELFEVRALAGRRVAEELRKARDAMGAIRRAEQEVASALGMSDEELEAERLGYSWQGSCILSLARAVLDRAPVAAPTQVALPRDLESRLLVIQRECEVALRNITAAQAAHREAGGE